MTKRRWVQDSQTGELIEITADYLPQLQADAGALYKDTWAQSRVKRDRLFTEGGTFSKRDIERAISQLQDRQ